MLSYIFLLSRLNPVSFSKKDFIKSAQLSDTGLGVGGMTCSTLKSSSSATDPA